MIELKLPTFGIVITYHPDDTDNATIVSDMHEPIEEQEGEESIGFKGAVNAIESMVLAHFCAGVDVTLPEYLEGIETAYTAASNYYS